MIPKVTPGWDVVLIARQAISKTTYQETQTALNGLLVRAQILQERKLG